MVAWLLLLLCAAAACSASPADDGDAAAEAEYAAFYDFAQAVHDGRLDAPVRRVVVQRLLAMGGGDAFVERQFAAYDQRRYRLLRGADVVCASQPLGGAAGAATYETCPLRDVTLRMRLYDAHAHVVVLERRPIADIVEFSNNPADGPRTAAEARAAAARRVLDETPPESEALPANAVRAVLPVERMPEYQLYVNAMFAGDLRAWVPRETVDLLLETSGGAPFAKRVFEGTLGTLRDDAGRRPLYRLLDDGAGSSITCGVPYERRDGRDWCRIETLVVAMRMRDMEYDEVVTEGIPLHKVVNYKLRNGGTTKP